MGVVTDFSFPEGSMITVIGESSQLVPASDIGKVILDRTSLPVVHTSDKPTIKLDEENAGAVQPGEFNFWTGKDVALPKYLIRVDVGPQSTPHGDLMVICSFWQFPKMPNLDFIEQVYVCETNGCPGVLPKEVRTRLVTGDVIWVCQTCLSFFQEGEVEKDANGVIINSLVPGARGFLGSGMYAYSRNVAGIADVVAHYWERFGGLCEIMLMRRRLSVQKMVNRYMSGEYGSDADIAYTKSAGSDKETGVIGCYYTLAGLLKDTAAGSTLRTRLAVFLAGG